jgi:epoxyqueuosine reductase
MAYMADHLPLRRDPRQLLPGAQSVIACALSYRRPNPARPGYPRIATYALGRDYHKVLRAKLRRIGRVLAAHSGAAWRACVDSAPLMEREYAHRAGLGWFGKNTCLIDSRSGSYFVLGFLLTDAWLAPDRPSLGGCGTCRLCVEACPTGAIVARDGVWQIESGRCVSYLTIEHQGPIPEELEDGVGDWTFGCDVCQDVCPFNQTRPSQPDRAPETREPDFREDRRWPTLDELAVIEQEAWDRLTVGSAVRRAGLEGLRRNARVNIANRR